MVGSAIAPSVPKHARQDHSAIVLPNELRRDVGRGVEVPVAWRVEGEIGVGFPTLALSIGIDTAEVPESPSRQVRSPGDVAGVHLEKIDLVQRVRVPCSTEDGEEHQQ